MSLCCIGGVCVPYTAGVPIILMGLKWLVGKLAEYGLLPDSAVKYLGLQQVNNNSNSKESCDTKSCCTGTKAPAALESATSVQVIETEEDFNALRLKNQTMVIKFTATWCVPCKAIAPVYKELSENYAAHFLEVDVDDLDEIASQYKVAVMPTFCIVNGQSLSVETMTGSNEHSLRTFMESYLTKRERAVQ